MIVSSLWQLFLDAKGNPTMKLTLPNHLEVTKLTLWHQKSLKTKPYVTLEPFGTFGFRTPIMTLVRATILRPS